MKLDKIRIPEPHHRSRKISDDVRKNIKEYYSSCKSFKATAEAFSVSRLTVHYIVDPEYKERRKVSKTKRDTYPSRSKKMRRIEKQRQRAYKAQLIKDGIMKICTDCKKKQALLGDYCVDCAKNIPA